MKKSILVGCIFAAIITGITVGIIVHVYNENVLEKATIKEVENANNFKERESNLIATGTKKERTSPNCILIFETFYNGCSHTEIKKEDIESAEVNKDEEYFKNKYSNWKLSSFKSNEVKLYREVDEMCKKHYIIKEKDGYIAIYNVDIKGNHTLKEVTDIYTKYLPEEDIELLKRGIEANGDNELSQRLGDFE